LIFHLILFLRCLQLSVNVINTRTYNIIHVYSLTIGFNPSLHAQHSQEDTITSISVIYNLCIDVQSKDSRRVLSRNIVVNILLLVNYGFHHRDDLLLSLLFVNVQEEWFPLVEHEVSEVLVQLAIQYSAVPVVSDTSSLHCLPDELFK